MASDISPQLRARVAARADYRCEYCRTHEDDAGFPHQVDHIVSRKHGGASSLDNLAYACILCNRYKGSDIASIDPGTHDIVRLFHPRLHQWTDHFQVVSGVLEPLTEIGQVTARLLCLNKNERIIERVLLGWRN